MREAIFIFLFYAATLSFMFMSIGCGASGEDDQQETTSSESNVDIVDCSGATFEGLDAEEVAELVEAAEESAEFVIEDEGGLDQQTRTFKVTVLQGCGNTVINEDNDINTAVDLSGSEESEAL